MNLTTDEREAIIRRMVELDKQLAVIYRRDSSPSIDRMHQGAAVWREWHVLSIRLRYESEQPSIGPIVPRADECSSKS